jgi:tetratricopeptide (TPR) repeat protein
LLQAGRKDEAIAVFRANVDAYPKSANVHDSLGEAYEMNGDLENAREQYELAWKRGREINDMNVKVYKTNFDRVSKKQD